ncbi:MAG: DNA topoisomerase IV subunit B, partial [Clostridia bacterium]|nr:DNA topoisomerase IV subunit B [Clostridia bacterium]
GLGEMNAEQLWETTMNPETRTIIRIDMDDALKADETFSLLMGEKVEPRRDFIQRNAKYVTNLDV